jgi:hypothetical protein
LFVLPSIFVVVQVPRARASFRSSLLCPNTYTVLSSDRARAKTGHSPLTFLEARKKKKGSSGQESESPSLLELHHHQALEGDIGAETCYAYLSPGPPHHAQCIISLYNSPTESFLVFFIFHSCFDLNLCSNERRITSLGRPSLYLTSTAELRSFPPTQESAFFLTLSLPLSLRFSFFSSFRSLVPPTFLLEV